MDALTTSLYEREAIGLASSFLNFSIGMLLIPLIISLAVTIFLMICQWIIFKKAGKNGWEAIVPVYNFVILLKITELPMWYIALLFIPFAQIYVIIKINIELAKKFGESGGFAALLILVPVVGFPILAFDKKKVYNGGTFSSQGQYGVPQQPTMPQQPMDQSYQQPATFQQPIPQQATQPQFTQPMQPQMPAQQPVQPKQPMDPAK